MPATSSPNSIGPEPCRSNPARRPPGRERSAARRLRALSRAPSRRTPSLAAHAGGRGLQDAKASAAYLKAQGCEKVPPRPSLRHLPPEDRRARPAPEAARGRAAGGDCRVLHGRRPRARRGLRLRRGSPARPPAATRDTAPGEAAGLRSGSEVGASFGSLRRACASTASTQGWRTWLR